MCGFTFAVFLSAFLLLPTAPFRILALGGSSAAAGLFLGGLTWSSALSAPITGAIADRIGRTRMLLVSSLAIAGFSVAYAVVPTWPLLVGLVVVHGVFWSGLLSASSAHLVSFVPDARRAEAISYWGMSTMLAISIAPALGLTLQRRGWTWVCGASFALNLAMAGVAILLGRLGEAPRRPGPLLPERPVDGTALSLSASIFPAFLAYGGITSFVALFAEARGARPSGLFFTSFAVAILATRPVLGRLADRAGGKAFLVPCLVLAAAALVLLSRASGPAGFAAAGALYGASFGNVYPALAALATKDTPPDRRGAAFGSLLLAMDTGIGTGSFVTGALVASLGFPGAFLSGAAFTAASLPLFLGVERVVARRRAAAREDVPPGSGVA